MSARRATYLDSSAIVKLMLRDPESTALHRYLRNRRLLVSSAIARTEVIRAFLPLGDQAVKGAEDLLTRFSLLRVNDRVLSAAGALRPAQIRSLDAIHIATAQQVGAALSTLVTYDKRMAEAAADLGLRVSAPS